MKYILLLATLLISFGCSKEIISDQQSDAIFQVGTLQDLLDSDYDGKSTFGTLAQQGDFGVGTFESIDGEMIMLNGVAYQITDDGQVHIVSEEQSTPFAVVKHFDRDIEFSLRSVANLNDLQQLINEQLIDTSGMYGIQVQATFDSLTIRSVSRQTRPYPPLGQVVAEQVVFTHSNITGTLVGFKFPHSIGTINVPGYHFHFIAEDRQAGGHVLSIEIQNGTVLIDQASELLVRF